MDICILDDDRRSFSTYAAAVKSCFEEFGVSANIDVYDSADSLRKRLSSVRYDVMFLDIDMPQEDGIEFAKSLRKKNDAVPIIFVTAREERMFEVFSVQPFGFVRKGKFLSDLREAVRLFLEANPDFATDIIMFETASGAFSVNVKQIVYIENISHSQILHVKDDQRVEIRSRMVDLEDRLVAKGFIRIHKGYIVNHRFIKRIDVNDVILTNDETLPLGRTYKKSVKELWLEYGLQNGFTYIS